MTSPRSWLAKFRWAIFLVAAVIVTAVSSQQRFRDGEPKFLDTAAPEVFRPGGDRPEGLRLMAHIDTERLGLEEKEPVEFSIQMSPAVSKLYLVAAAEVYTLKERKVEEAWQPYHNQRPPEGVDAQLLIKGLPHGEYGLDVYLEPRAERVDPKEAMELLGGREARRDNFRIFPVLSFRDS